MRGKQSVTSIRCPRWFLELTSSDDPIGKLHSLQPARRPAEKAKRSMWPEALIFKLFDLSAPNTL